MSVEHDKLMEKLRAAIEGNEPASIKADETPEKPASDGSRILYVIDQETSEGGYIRLPAPTASAASTAPAVPVPVPSPQLVPSSPPAALQSVLPPPPVSPQSPAPTPLEQLASTGSEIKHTKTSFFSRRLRKRTESVHGYSGIGYAGITALALCIVGSCGLYFFTRNGAPERVESEVNFKIEKKEEEKTGTEQKDPAHQKTGDTTPTSPDPASSPPPEESERGLINPPVTDPNPAKTSSLEQQISNTVRTAPSPAISSPSPVPSRPPLHKLSLKRIAPYVQCLLSYEGKYAVVFKKDHEGYRQGSQYQMERKQLGSVHYSNHDEQHEQFVVTPEEASSSNRRISCKNLFKPVPLTELPKQSATVYVVKGADGAGEAFVADFRKNSVERLGFDTTNYFIIDTKHDVVLHKTLVDGSYLKLEISSLYHYRPTGTDSTLQPQPNAAWLYEQPVKGE